MLNLNVWGSFKLEYYTVKFREEMKPESVCKAEGKIRSMRTFGTKTITTRNGGKGLRMPRNGKGILRT